MAGYMDLINKDSMIDRTTQLLTSFEWDLTFKTWPPAVFCPGQSIFRIRTTGIEPPKWPDNTPISAQLHGFRVIQSGLTENTGTFTINYQDFEDQSLVAFFLDWTYKSCDPATRSGYRNEDLMSDIILYRLNSSRKATKMWKCMGCLPANVNHNDAMNSDKTPIGDGTISLEVEYYEIKLLNLPG